MKNLRMHEKLNLGECVDVNQIGRPLGKGLFELRQYEDGTDYCDAVGEEWIWSIGRHAVDGTIVASIDTRFYDNPLYECLWLR